MTADLLAFKNSQMFFCIIHPLIFSQAQEKTMLACKKYMWAREDLNLQGLLHTVLNRTRMPVPPRARYDYGTGKTASWQTMQANENAEKIFFPAFGGTTPPPWLWNKASVPEQVLETRHQMVGRLVACSHTNHRNHRKQSGGSIHACDDKVTRLDRVRFSLFQTFLNIRFHTIFLLLAEYLIPRFVLYYP